MREASKQQTDDIAVVATQCDRITNCIATARVRIAEACTLSPDDAKKKAAIAAIGKLLGDIAHLLEKTPCVNKTLFNYDPDEDTPIDVVKEEPEHNIKDRMQIVEEGIIKGKPKEREPQVELVAQKLTDDAGRPMHKRHKKRTPNN